MQKSKSYPQTFFPPEIIRRAKDTFEQTSGLVPIDKLNAEMFVTHGMVTWTFDTTEEFYADYNADATEAQFMLCISDYWFKVNVTRTRTCVSVISKSRSHIEGVFQIFEGIASSCRRPLEAIDTPKPVIFIGHGHSPLWRDLKDHLTDKHGYCVQAYEVGSRTGHAVRDVLEDMLTRSSMAFLVLTAEDETATGTYHARQNVIHETGLFQGRLGFSRAIVLLEDGTQEFSNIAGIEQIRFNQGSIKETFGDVLAAIKREYPDSA